MPISGKDKKIKTERRRKILKKEEGNKAKTFESFMEDGNTRYKLLQKERKAK